MGKKFTIEEKASRTAMWTTICRAMASMEPDPKSRGADNMASMFIPSAKNFLLNFGFIRRFVRRKLTPGAYEYLVARTKHYDRLFKQALDEDIPQILLLGAGYDTRSIRFQHAIRQTRIFELDAHPTQQQKMGILQKSNVSIPRQLSFVRINFSKEDMDKVLSKSGFDKTRKSLFIWEGVTMYLREKDVEKTLGFIKNNSGHGTTVAFDYFFKSVVDGNSENYGAREQYEAVQKLGEPFRFGIEEEKIDAFLKNNNFNVLSHYTPDEFEDRYLRDDHGNLYGKMYRCACNVHAGVNTKRPSSL